MAYQARIKDTMTKKELIEEYHRLLDLFNQEVAATKEAQDRVSELERKTDQEALDAGLATTVDSVFEGASRLRALAGATLNDLADKMGQQAEKLERLNRAVALQEARLKELHQIEHAADTMAKLAAAYAEEKARLEGEFSSRTVELEGTHARKAEHLERVHAERRAQLEREVAEERARWEMEKDQAAREREREEAEYQYNKERGQRLEEEEHADRRAALEKELRRLKEETERELAEREAAIRAREQELERLAAEAAAFPERLERAVREAREEARTQAVKEMKHQAELAQLERDWERKSLEQTIAHLQEANRALEVKLAEQVAELREARKQVNAIAEKAVEGASFARALAGGAPLADQGRPPEKSRKE